MTNAIVPAYAAAIEEAVARFKKGERRVSICLIEGAFEVFLTGKTINAIVQDKALLPHFKRFAANLAAKHSVDEKSCLVAGAKMLVFVPQ